MLQMKGIVWPYVQSGFNWLLFSKGKYKNQDNQYISKAYNFR